MRLYEYVVISKVTKKKKVPKILEGPELIFAEDQDEVRAEVYYGGHNPKEVDILVRPFC